MKIKDVHASKYIKPTSPVIIEDKSCVFNSRGRQSVTYVSSVLPEKMCSCFSFSFVLLLTRTLNLTQHELVVQRLNKLT